MESAPSRTAMFAAVSRGLFRLETASPWVLDDVLALVLVGPVWQQLRDPARTRGGPEAGSSFSVLSSPGDRLVMRRSGLPPRVLPSR